MLRWLRIGVIVVIGLGLIVLAVGRNLSDAAAARNPAFAMTVAPGNGMAQDRIVRLQVATLLQKPGKVDYSSVTARARQALRSEPFALASLIALVERERSDGHVAVADALLDYAAGLSRRDPLIQMELIKRAGATRDYKGLVRHIDETLRANQNFYGRVFPFLAHSLRDPEIVRLLTPVAREDPPWYTLFIGEALTISSALPGVRHLLLTAPNGNAARDPHIRANLINQLVAAKQVDLARSYFEALHPDVHGPIIDADFTHPALEGPFGWVLNEDPDLSADFIRGEGLLGFAGGAREGTIARQLLSLSPGSHQIGIEAARADLPAIHLEVTCLVSGHKLTATTEPRKGTFSFAVPAGCGDQWLSIDLRDGDDARAIEVSIRRLTLS